MENLIEALDENEAFWALNPLMMPWGQYFYLGGDNLSHQDINIYTLAKILFKKQRFNDHSPYQYSVLEHSLLVMAIVAELIDEVIIHKEDMQGAIGYSDNELVGNVFQTLLNQAFFHDFTEAFIGDIPTPIKRVVPEISNLEKNIWESCLSTNLNLPKEFHTIIKIADQIAFYIEARALDRHTLSFDKDEIYRNLSKDFMKDLHSFTTKFIKPINKSFISNRYARHTDVRWADDIDPEVSEVESKISKAMIDIIRHEQRVALNYSSLTCASFRSMVLFRERTLTYNILYETPSYDNSVDEFFKPLNEGSPNNDIPLSDRTKHISVSDKEKILNKMTENNVMNIHYYNEALENKLIEMLRDLQCYQNIKFNSYNDIKYTIKSRYLKFDYNERGEAK